MKKIILLSILVIALILAFAFPAQSQNNYQIYDFPAGTTNLTSPIYYSDNTVIKGQGKGITILDATGLAWAIMPASHTRQIYNLQIKDLTIINSQNGILLQDAWNPRFDNIEVTEYSDIGLWIDGGQFGTSGLLATNFFATEGGNGILFGISSTGFLSINKFIGGGVIGHVWSGIVLATSMGGQGGIATTYFDGFQIECNKWGARIGDSNIGVSKTVFMNCFWDTNFDYDLINFAGAGDTTVISGLIHLEKVYEQVPIKWFAQ